MPGDGNLRVDIQVTGFENPSSISDYDVVVFNPDSQSYFRRGLSTIFKEKIGGKDRLYKPTCNELIHNFQAIAMTVDGVMSDDTQQLVKDIASKIADKWEKPNGVVTAWVRSKIALALVRSASACIRGARSRKNEWQHLNQHGFEDGAGMEQHLTANAIELDSLQAASTAVAVEGRQAETGAGGQGERAPPGGELNGWIGGRLGS